MFSGLSSIVLDRCTSVGVDVRAWFLVGAMAAGLARIVALIERRRILRGFAYAYVVDEVDVARLTVSMIRDLLLEIA